MHGLRYFVLLHLLVHSPPHWNDFRLPDPYFSGWYSASFDIVRRMKEKRTVRKRRQVMSLAMAAFATYLALERECVLKLLVLS
uniref:Uncharacterized protein n=1 Tax=Noccaea caerulescens TaxID=107243 RepID=A0A1J3HY73_NOCCA